MEDHDLEPTPEESAAMIKSATFGLLVSNLLESMGQEKAASWALSDHLQAHGFHKAAAALRGMVDGLDVDWFVHGVESSVSKPPGHNSRKVELIIRAVGTEKLPALDD